LSKRERPQLDAISLVVASLIDKKSADLKEASYLTDHMGRIPDLDLTAQYNDIRPEVLSALERICEPAKFTQEPATGEFEEKFEEYCGVAHCVGLNSGTSALHPARRWLDIGLGDEVIAVAMSFIATAWAISYVDAKPLFIDIDPVRRTMCPARLEAAITERTKAIIPVHLYGIPAEKDRR